MLQKIFKTFAYADYLSYLCRMLQALLHNKYKSSFDDDKNYKSSEDSVTSSVIGLLQYLPSDVLSSILKKACGVSTSFPNELGEIKDVLFWEQWRNNARVEPDVLIASENYNIIIEIKKRDDNGHYCQYRGQWENEIQAYGKSYTKSQQKLLLIALGGNDDMCEDWVDLEKVRVPIYRASWFNLLHAVGKELECPHPPHVRRLLNDVVNAFEFNGFFDIEWLDSLPEYSLSSDSISIFEKPGSFSEFYSPQMSLNIKTIKIWMQ